MYSLFDYRLNIIHAILTEKIPYVLTLIFLRHGGTKQKRGRPLVAVNCTQFWGCYSNGQGHPGQTPSSHRRFQAL